MNKYDREVRMNQFVCSMCPGRTVGEDVVDAHRLMHEDLSQHPTIAPAEHNLDQRLIKIAQMSALQQRIADERQKQATEAIAAGCTRAAVEAALGQSFYERKPGSKERRLRPTYRGEEIK